jgi:hypothetical protein
MQEHISRCVWDLIKAVARWAGWPVSRSRERVFFRRIALLLPGVARRRLTLSPLTAVSLPPAEDGLKDDDNLRAA